MIPSFPRPKSKWKTEKVEKSELIPLGQALFTPRIFNEVLNSFKKTHEKVLSEKKWGNDRGSYPNSSWSYIFSMMQVALVEEIYFASSKVRTTFFKDILHIKFENLTCLLLSENYIESIESLVYLDAPNLKDISLEYNKILHLTKTISKFNFKYLAEIHLSDNLMLEVDLSRVQLINQTCFLMSHNDWKTHKYERERRQIKLYNFLPYAKIEYLHKSVLDRLESHLKQEIQYKTWRNMRLNENEEFEEIKEVRQIIQLKCLSAIFRKGNKEISIEPNGEVIIII